MKFIIFFDGQFWCGISENPTANGINVKKFVFGSEPVDKEILDFVNQKLFNDSDSEREHSCTDNPLPVKRISPKRMKRLAAKEVNQKGISTKSQETLREEKEQYKKQKKRKSREEKEMIKEMKRLKKVEKKKLKKRGR